MLKFDNTFQAARFRVYAYGKDGNVLGEIDGKDEYTLKWTVHVANKKAAWVVFRGQHNEETMKLRNADVQGWVSSDFLAVIILDLSYLPLIKQPAQVSSNLYITESLTHRIPPLLNSYPATRRIMLTPIHGAS